MTLTLDQIVEQVRSWPREQVSELVDRLAATICSEDSIIDQAWRQETRQRVTDIESGVIKGIPGEEVSARIRRLTGR